MEASAGDPGKPRAEDLGLASGEILRIEVEQGYALCDSADQIFSHQLLTPRGLENGLDG